jgi:hypothetical protein
MILAIVLKNSKISRVFRKVINMIIDVVHRAFPRHPRNTANNASLFFAENIRIRSVFPNAANTANVFDPSHS